jgi:hypothetical protein
VLRSSKDDGEGGHGRRGLLLESGALICPAWSLIGVDGGS